MTETANSVKVRGRKRATFALLLSLGALCASGYLYYEGVKVHAHASYQLQYLDNLAVSNNLQLQQELASINRQIDSLKNKVDGLGSDKFSAGNYQLNALISLANQSLVAYHDVNAAIKLLTYAQNVIAANNNAIYTELKVALTTDVDKLKQLPVLDRVIIATKLNNIIASTDHLELMMNNEPAANIAAVDVVQPKWKQFLTNIENKLFGLVQVSNADKNDALNLLPQHEVIIHQNVKLDILNARMALLQNDEANWQYSLTAAKQSLSAYFVNNNNMHNTLEEISQLQQLNIANSEVSIDNTLKALNKLNNLN